jgi:hypothetical protein
VQYGPVTIPAWLARIQYPGSSSAATLLLPRGGGYLTATPATLAVPAGSEFDWPAFGIGIAAAAGIALIGAAGLLAIRRRRPLAHV